MPKIFQKNYTKKQLLDMIGDISQVAHIRRAELIEGRERGAGLIEVYNASGLCFSVLPGRSLDIASAHYKGIPLGFRTNTGDVGPAFYEPAGNGWMRGFFGGLVVTCGMTFIGHPETDPKEENEELGLHGRLSFLPAKNVSADGSWEGDDYVMRIGGKIREAVPFATNLELTREISMVLGERSFCIHDRIENLDAAKSPLMLAYHCNPGFPILDAGSRFIINSRKSTEWIEDREVGPDAYAEVPPPAEEMRDDVFVHQTAADEDGVATVGLVNDRLGIGLYWKFPSAEMPIVNQWQHFHRGTYVTGVEPGNASMLGRAWNRKNNMLQYIEPGEVREFHLEIGIVEGEEEIINLERKVEANK